MGVRLYKEVLWLAPYLQAARGLVSTRGLTKVMGYQVAADSDEVVYGRLWKYEDGRRVITVATRLPDGKRIRFADVLQVFAHELAHLKYWEHTPKHWELENKIAARFARVAERLGVKDTTTRRYVR